MPTPTATIFLPWHALDEAIQRGTRAAQPAASAVVPGTLYSVTDEGSAIERSTGTVWQPYGATGSGGGGGTGNADTLDGLDSTDFMRKPMPLADLPAHHASHEPGGADALANAAWTTVANTFTAPQTLAQGGPVVSLVDTAQPANLRRFDLKVASQSVTLQPTNDVGSASGGLALDRTGNLAVAGTLTAQGLGSTPLNASNLTSGVVPAAQLTAANLPAHAARHNAGGADALAVDAAAATGSLRTLGTGAQQAAPGNDARFAAGTAAHHATHEPGGTDALANAAWTNQQNTFTQNQLMVSGSPTTVWTDTSQPANSRVFFWANAGQQFYVTATTDAYALQATPLTLTRTGDAKIGADLYEKGRPTPMGHWQDEPFSAAKFTGGGSLVWTVAAGNVQTNRYTLLGKTLCWTVYLNATSLSGTASGQLLLTLPGGVTSAAGRGANATAQLYDGAFNQGMVFVSTSTQVAVQKDPAVVFTLNTGTTYVIFSITLEILWSGPVEELVLTDPVVVPAQTTAKYHVVAFTMNLEGVAVPGGAPGLVLIDLRDNNDLRSSYRYEGAPATAMIKQLNTANLTTKSMHKRILEKLSADGLLPGSVVGAPDP